MNISFRSYLLEIILNTQIYFVYFGRNISRQAQVIIYVTLSKYNERKSFISNNRYSIKINHRHYHILVHSQSLKEKKY